MNSVERHYRITAIRERIQQLTGELLALGDGLENKDAEQAISLSGRALIESEAHLRVVMTLEDPATLLALSLADIREKQKGELLAFPQNNAG